MECSAATADAAVMVSMSMASTTLSRVVAEKTGASLVLAAVSRLTAITSPTSAASPVLVPLSAMPAPTLQLLAASEHPGAAGLQAGEARRHSTRVKQWSRRR